MTAAQNKSLQSTDQGDAPAVAVFLSVAECLQGLPFCLGWPYCVLCTVGPPWEERHSPDVGEPPSAWLSDTEVDIGVLLAILHSFTHSFIHWAPTVCRHQGEEKAGTGPALWSSLSPGESGREQTGRPAGQTRPGLPRRRGRRRSEGSGPAGTARSPWEQQAQTPQEGRKRLLRGWREPAAAASGERFSSFQEQRGAAACLGFAVVFLFFGGRCDQLHSVKCESYFGGKIDKKRW